MKLRKSWKKGAAVAAASFLLLTAAACGNGDATGDATPDTGDTGLSDTGDDAGTDDPTGEFPRNETLFTMGTMWGPPTQWMPFAMNSGATGALGLIYETLFNFDLDNLELVPWLATSGEWADANTFVIELRDGVYWHDGEPLTVDDVIWSFEVGQMEGVGWGTDLWSQLDSVTADGNTITFAMSDPRPEQWTNIMYTRPIWPSHIMGEWDAETLMTADNNPPVGSGPFTLYSAGQDRVVYQRNDNWWGATERSMPMRYIVDIVNTSNEVVFGLLQQGQLDLSNNFLPGIHALVSQGTVGTFFADAPYMLSANPALVIPNHERFPMNDVNFRRALASSIDVDLIIATAFGNLVQGSSPTGLLPIFDQFVNDSLVSQHGFTFDVDEANRILDEAGFALDGQYRTLPDGSPMNVELIVPTGWTDWMDAANVIRDSAAEAGIQITVNFPDAQSVQDRMVTGDFDLLINNWSQVSNSPWVWWSYVYSYPITDNMWGGNFGRYPGTEQWSLVQQLARSTQGSAEFTAANDALQEHMLTQLPMIPLWYNGLWAQWTEVAWTGWPTENNRTGWPSTWHGYWQLGMIDVLANLTPVG